MFDYQSILQKHHVTVYGSAELAKELRVYSEFPNVISFALPLPRAVVKEITDKGPTKTYFHHYRTCNAYIDHVSYALVLAIKKEGYDAMYIPASQSVSEDGLAGVFPHKTAASLCGLGGIGKNCLLITPQYGAAVRLGTVMTDISVKKATPIQNPCIKCGACVAACPSGALTGKSWEKDVLREEMIDAGLCSAYMKKAYRKIGRGAVCGICMAVCPIQK